MQKPISDLVVDGTKTQEKIADEILAHINTFNHCGALIDGSYIKIATKSDLHYTNKYLRQKFIFAGNIAPDSDTFSDISHWCANGDKTTCDAQGFYIKYISDRLHTDLK